MSRFTDALIVSPMADGKTWVLVRHFGYEVGAEGSGDVIEVPIGFQTDFASVPRLFWIFLPKWGTYGNASVIHDWLYWDQTRPKAEADTIFLEAMGVLNVNPITKWLMYQAVHLLGFIAWYRNRADRAAGFDRVLGTTAFKAATRSQRPGTLVRFTRHLWKTVAGGSGAAP
ncbi:MAG: DUF1353 domain-containing protein [Nitrospiraceae bacterium]